VETAGKLMDAPVEAFWPTFLALAGEEARFLNVCCSVPRSSQMTLFSSASIFSQKASAAKRVHHCDLPKGRMIDLRRQ